MKRVALAFDRPPDRQATRPPEERGLERDEVRLMVSTAAGHQHARFRDLPSFLEPGTLLVVNRSATLAASLPAHGPMGGFRLNLATRYGAGIWLAEPRRGAAEPGPLPLQPGDTIRVADLPARVLAPYPTLPRLVFLRIEGDLDDAMARAGRPIRYGYLEPPYPHLSAYQTLFGDTPGSAEMPSAARPFTPRVVDALRARGVRVATILLHTGVSSLEIESDQVDDHHLHPEPFAVPRGTARAVNAARREGRPVIAVGTTVVRALESAVASNASLAAGPGARGGTIATGPGARGGTVATSPGARGGTVTTSPGARGGMVATNPAASTVPELRAVSGFTRRFVRPGHAACVVDGLITGLHDPHASHLALLFALADPDMIRDAYGEAVRESYLWHEFGDIHLVMGQGRAALQA